MENCKKKNASRLFLMGAVVFGCRKKISEVERRKTKPDPIDSSLFGFISVFKNSKTTMSTEEVDKHVLRKYELQQRLGKGVRSVDMVESAPID
jgi:hypothetical protein